MCSLDVMYGWSLQAWHWWRAGMSHRMLFSAMMCQFGWTYCILKNLVLFLDDHKLPCVWMTNTFPGPSYGRYIDSPCFEWLRVLEFITHTQLSNSVLPLILAPKGNPHKHRCRDVLVAQVLSYRSEGCLFKPQYHQVAIIGALNKSHNSQLYVDLDRLIWKVSAKCWKCI